MAIPNLGAYAKSWRDLLDLRKLQGAKAGLPLAPHCVCGPRYSRNHNDTFRVPPLRKSGTSSKKKRMKKRKEKMKKMKKMKQMKKMKKMKQMQKMKKKKTGKKLCEKRRNGKRTRGGTDCEREPGTVEGIFSLYG